MVKSTFFKLHENTIEYSELQGTHKDHGAQLPAPCKTT